MSKIKCKGTALAQEIASVYTTVAQVISLELPTVESETFEADTLDNTDAGIPYQATGRTEGGSCSGELFYDPALQGHQNLTELLRVPQDENWKITFADTGSSTWTFTGAGFSLGGTVALNDGLKASFSIKLDGIPTYPTGGSAA
jgi:hypothetical protein